MHCLNIVACMIVYINRTIVTRFQKNYLSMGAIGAMGSSCNSLLSLLNDLYFDKNIQNRIIMNTMNISTRSSYYIFRRRNKPWANPELLAI